MPAMLEIRSADDLPAVHGGVLVPTMGALHDGHVGLVERARAVGSPVIVSIFVNPTQFGPGEDLDRYPRDPDGDLARARQAGAEAVFVPEPALVYPPGVEIPVPPLPAVATEPGLEDARRPGHFEGVAQVVARLFDLLRPAAAIFGEKDYQQLRLIEDLVDAEAIAHPGRWDPLRIHRGPTVRDRDGLALSSRNRYLSAEQRERALGLSRALRNAHAAQRPLTAEAMMRTDLEAHGLAIDYAVVRDARTLAPVADFGLPTRALIAARLDDVRLIDNAPMTVWT